MSLLELRRKARRAECELERERDRWRKRVHALGEHYVRHRAAWLLGGFGAGIVAGLLPLRTGALLGRSIASAASLLLRSPLTSLLYEQARQRLGEASARTGGTGAQSRTS